MTAAVEATVGKTKKGKGPARPGAKRQAQVTLPQGDTGPESEGQMRNAEVIPMAERGGDWRRKRRLHTLDWMVRRIGSDGKRKREEITVRQRDAGMELWRRYVETQRTGSPPWYRPYVDGGRLGGQVDTRQLEALAAYQALERAVPERLRYLAHFVCCLDRGLDEYTSDADRRAELLEELREALKILAFELRY